MHAEIERIIMDILEFYGFKVRNVKNRIISAEGKHAEEIFVSYALPDDAVEDILLAYIAVVRRMKALILVPEKLMSAFKHSQRNTALW
jgi:hypothetical protein